MLDHPLGDVLSARVGVIDPQVVGAIVELSVGAEAVLVIQL